MKKRMIIITGGGWLNTFQRPHQLVKIFRNFFHTEVIAHVKPLPDFTFSSRDQLRLVDKVHILYCVGGSSVFRLLKKVNSFLFTYQLNRIFRSESFRKSDVIYSWNIKNTSYLEYCAGKILIYDAMDDWSEFETDPDIKNAVIENERKVAVSANLVLTVSEKLFQKFKPLNPNTLLVRNGVDLEYFSKICRNYQKSEKDALFPFRDKVIIGYMGYVSDWFDAGLVVDAAKKVPDCLFVIVGPGDKDKIAMIRQVENIKYFGHQQYSELKRFVSYFSVGIIPFRLNVLNESTNPIKLYEYLGAGIPVVSTSMNEVALFREEGIVYTADTAEEFAAAIKNAISLQHRADLVNRRIEVAGLNSWEARASLVMDAIAELS